MVSIAACSVEEPRRPGDRRAERGPPGTRRGQSRRGLDPLQGLPEGRTDEQAVPVQPRPDRPDAGTERRGRELLPPGARAGPELRSRPLQPGDPAHRRRSDPGSARHVHEGDAAPAGQRVCLPEPGPPARLLGQGNEGAAALATAVRLDPTMASRIPAPSGSPTSTAARRRRARSRARPAFPPSAAGSLTTARHVRAARRRGMPIEPSAKDDQHRQGDQPERSARRLDRRRLVDGIDLVPARRHRDADV